jgi:carboxymethylenebutenolidase
MCDQDHSEKELQELDASGLITRRQFGVLLGAGVAMILPQTPNAVKVTEGEVTIKTPDGMADAYFVHPATGTAPGVLVWPDIFGLRPAFKQQMGKRLAESGYSVLVVNPFYRTKKAPTAEQGAATPIAGLMPLMNAVMNETTQMSDAKAFIAWLDQQPSVAKNRKMGTQGYCMGGPFALRTAAASDRIGAAASFHGAQLVTDMPNSPHLQAAKTKAQFLIAIATNDDTRSPNDKTAMKDTFAKAGVKAEIEVYAGAQHGWCPPDSGVYNMPQAEKAWSRLLALYGSALSSS